MTTASTDSSDRDRDLPPDGVDSRDNCDRVSHAKSVLSEQGYCLLDTRLQTGKDSAVRFGVLHLADAVPDNMNALVGRNGRHLHEPVTFADDPVREIDAQKTGLTDGVQAVGVQQKVVTADADADLFEGASI